MQQIHLFFYHLLLRDVSQHKCDILLEDFVNHFKDINNLNKTHCNLYEPEIKCTLNRYEKEEFNVMFKELDVDIMHSEVKTAIEQLKAGKSAGHDLLINEFFMSGKKHKFIYDGIELEITNAFSYLGIVFSPNGLYNKAQRQLSQQGNKAMFKLFSSVSKFRNLNPGILLDLFDKLILPILCYSCEVWGFNVGKDIERVHLRFCKYILRIKNNTLNEIVYGELGRRPLYVYRMTRTIKYWIHIMELEENRYVKCMYNVLYQRSLINVTRSWVTEVRNLLCNCGFAEVWYNQSVRYNEDFLKVVTQRIYDIYSQDWSAKLHESPSSRTYILYKDALIFSKYISEIKIEKWRISLTRFRTNNHKLAIETGRWNKLPINERKCNFCLELEDEFHFLLECKLYITLRKRILPKYYWNRTNIFEIF